MRPLLAVLALLLLLPAAASAADETIASVAKPTPVDAWAGRVVFSAYDAATDRFALMLKRGGAAPVAVPVESKRSAFDVDLGRGPDGHATAVYSRCTPNCDIYAYDFVAGAERRVRGVSTSAKERMPTISGGRIAFLRHGRIVVRTLSSGSERKVASPSKRGFATALELNGRRLAITWEDTPPDRTHDRIYLQRLGGARTVVDEASSGLLSTVETMQPAFEGGAIFYAVARRAASGNHFGRYDLGTRRTKDVVSRGGILSAAFDGGRFTFVQTGFDEDGQHRCFGSDGLAGPCLLKRTPPIAF